MLDTGSPEWAALLDTEPAAAPPVPTGGEDLAVLLYTSGTTGRPRGAMLSHRALLANLDQLSRIEPAVVAPDDVVLLVLPLFHVYGLNAGLGMTARAAATGVLVDRFDPVDTLALVREHGVTNIVGAPPMYLAWAMLPELAESFATLRLAVSGAAPLPAAVWAALRDATGTTVYEGYGLTETAPVLTTTLCSETVKPGSIGRAIPGVELRLVDDQGADALEGDPGEITVRGANLFSGYWPDGDGAPDSEGWFRTGDVAYADEDGDLFLVDRVRELILVSGFNVYPREVEDGHRRAPRRGRGRGDRRTPPLHGRDRPSPRRTRSGCRAVGGGGHRACRHPARPVQVPDLGGVRDRAAALGDRQGREGTAAGVVSARVLVLTKPGCHLCVDACAAVDRIAAELGVTWQERDITGDDELMTRWAEYVPVVLVDGEVHDWFRVREDRLRAALG